MSKTNGANGNQVLKIIVPILLVCVVVGIWVFKTLQNSPDAGLEDGNPDFVYTVKENLDIAKLKTYNIPIIIEFGADWCAPCKEMAPIIKSLNTELRDRAIVRFVDTDENQKASQAYNFQYIPTQLFINADGTPYNPANAAEMQMDLKYDPQTNELLYTTHTGTLTKEQLLDILKEMGMK